MCLFKKIKYNHSLHDKLEKPQIFITIVQVIFDL
jgi:hypothetical protein